MSECNTERQKVLDAMLEEALKQPGVADVVQVQLAWDRIAAELPQFQTMPPVHVVTSAISTEAIVEKI